MSESSVPYGYCHCGCGQKTNVAPKTVAKNGYVKGEPYKYRKGHGERKPSLAQAHLRDGEQRRCKVCDEWKNRATDFYSKSGYQCKVCRNEQVKQQRLERWRSHRENALWSRYRLRLEDFEAMLKAQHGRCGLCERTLKPNATVVDHDHKTGKTRALLCYACNAALGMLKDDPELLRKAARYVEDHRSSS